MPLESPRGILGGLDPERAAALIMETADVVLVVDAGGIIRDVALGVDDLSGNDCSGWFGQPWVDTVTPESRPNIEDLLRDAGNGEATVRRQVNHPSSRGVNVPVRYAAVRVGDKGWTIAAGRGLGAIASIRSGLGEARLAGEGEGACSDMPRSVERLKEMVGRVPLRDIVREATDVIERRCIEVALDLTRDNRALAAELLGLSRQSLYVKLRRFGMGNLGGESPE